MVKRKMHIFTIADDSGCCWSAAGKQRGLGIHFYYRCLAKVLTAARTRSAIPGPHSFSLSLTHTHIHTVDVIYTAVCLVVMTMHADSHEHFMNTDDNNVSSCSARWAKQLTAQQSGPGRAKPLCNSSVQPATSTLAPPRCCHTGR